MEGYIGGIALPTNVTLGKCIPSMLCVVDVYLTISYDISGRNYFNIRPNGQIWLFGTAIWSTKFGRPVFIYSAVRIRSFGPFPYILVFYDRLKQKHATKF